MFARRRAVHLGGKEVVRTPLLVPSFSSKGFPDLPEIMEATQQFITESALVSLYDLKYRQLKLAMESLPGVLFLDSGGYECSKDDEFRRLGIASKIPHKWTRDAHREQLRSTLLKIRRAKAACVPVVISYDHPEHRTPVPQQIQNASRFFRDLDGVVREILLKAPPKSGVPRDKLLLNIADVIPFIEDLRTFDVIGVTEKELGLSLFDRMVSLATLRRALERAKIFIPIHVFGSLDTISTPLFFLAGADLFDGLTWLRYTYYEGLTCYAANTNALRHSPRDSQSAIEVRSAIDNLNYLGDLTLQMRRYLNAREFNEFRHHADFVKAAAVNLFEHMKE